MKIEKRSRGDVTILEVEGKITIGKGDVALRDAVHQALGEGAKKIVMNLGSVSTVDSSGVGELVSAFTTVTNRGGRLKLLNRPALAVVGSRNATAQGLANADAFATSLSATELREHLFSEDAGALRLVEANVPRPVFETLLAFRRAGASGVLTYHALHAARLLSK